jgi:hypothetical protein
MKHATEPPGDIPAKVQGMSDSGVDSRIDGRTSTKAPASFLQGFHSYFQ